MDQPSYYQQGMDQTKQYEGFRSTPYTDTTGNPTIGYGFNMNANPGLPQQMDQQTADQYFQQYYKKASQTAQQFAGDNWGDLTDSQKAVLTDMAYNLHDKLFKFQHMQKALQNGDDTGVEREMKHSDWYGQVKSRAKQDISNWSK